MQISLIPAALQTWAPIAVIVFVIALVVLALWPAANQRRDQVWRFNRWLIERQRRSPRPVWVEIIALAVATALVVTLIDWLLKP